MPRSKPDAMTLMLFTPEVWIKRRIEAVHFLDSGETRRVVSIDFVLPKDCYLEGSKSRAVIPVAFRLKEPMRNLDTYAPDGSPLPVLGAEDSAAHSSRLLRRFAGNVTPDTPAETLKVLDRKLADVCKQPARDAARTARVIRRWAAICWEAMSDEGRLFLDVVEAFSQSFVLMLEVPADLIGVRAMVKFSYELPVDILEGAELPYNLELDGPQLWMSTSCHLEIGTPPGVQIEELVVREIGSQRQWRDPEPDPPTRAPGHRAHVNCRPTARVRGDPVRRPMASGSTLVSFQPDNRALVMAALTASWAAFVAFLLPTVAILVEKFSEVDLLSRGISESSVSLLLLGPAALVAYLGRAPEHQLVARVLWPLRRTILATVLALIVAAAIVGTRIQLPWDSWVTWSVLAAFQLVSAIRATRIWARVHDLTYTKRET